MVFGGATRNMMGCWAPALAWMSSWKFPPKFRGSSQTPQHNYSLMSYRAPVKQQQYGYTLLPHPQREVGRGLLDLPGPQFRDTVAQSHGQSTFREVLDFCPAVEPVVFGLFLGQASMSQLHIANDYRNPMKVNPILLNNQHSVYLFARITLEKTFQKRSKLEGI